jgi:hypothetical protein
MGRHGRGVLRQGVKFAPQIIKQHGELLAVVIMGDGSTHLAPKPLDAVGLRIVGGGVDEPELALGLGQQRAHQARRAACAQVVRDDEGHPSALTRAGQRGAELLTEEVGGALAAGGSDSAGGPAIIPDVVAMVSPLRVRLKSVTAIQDRDRARQRCGGPANVRVTSLVQLRVAILSGTLSYIILH